MNVGEEICGEWLRHIKGCEFVQYNLKPSGMRAEIDVIGINLSEKTVYACEVTVHLVTGLQYTKDKRPDNVNRLTAKFQKDIAYIREAFSDYEHVFMLWSPIVKGGAGRNPVYDQIQHVGEVIAATRKDLEELQNRLADNLVDPSASHIFHAHLHILNDPAVLEKIDQVIQGQRLAACCALRLATDEVAGRCSGSK